MEFKEAMRIWKRMCAAHEAAECKGCPLDEVCDGFCQAWAMTHTAEAEVIFAKWAAEHPEKTIADDFFEKHPRAKYVDGMVPGVCALYCGYGKPEYCQKDAAVCAKCWRRPLEEITKND